MVAQHLPQRLVQQMRRRMVGADRRRRPWSTSSSTASPDANVPLSTFGPDVPNRSPSFLLRVETSERRALAG
jgi:hypothetical protein